MTYRLCRVSNRVMTNASTAKCGKCGCPLRATDAEWNFPAFLSKHFQVLRLLGSGGFGEVYLCLNYATGASLAVKVLKNTDDLASLKREAKALSKLSHPNIGRVIGFLEEEVLCIRFQ